MFKCMICDVVLTGSIAFHNHLAFDHGLSRCPCGTIQPWYIHLSELIEERVDVKVHVDFHMLGETENMRRCRIGLAAVRKKFFEHQKRQRENHERHRRH